VSPRGKVYLVGAGPGDPELMTLKAVRLIRQADVVVYDRLVAPEILSQVPAGTTRIFAGKAAANHFLAQQEINDLLVRLASPARCVVRLKGGDPFIFGRGGEEAEHLLRHGIDCEVVPGVTSASGCAAEFGIPLTHRGLANGVRFVAGHCRENGELDLDWKSLADPDTTVVVYMGLANLPVIAQRLIAAGLPATTPAAAIASGTTGKRDLRLATLRDLPDRVAAANLGSPVLFIIGRVAALAETLGPARVDGPQIEAEARHA
jgi:uroporphyrin-III C-methyltransferase/precorrin-2 dehydrogenase/sirohydrochlorin ferrochelatase/uroporphyrin-III C-methyltransferase